MSDIQQNIHKYASKSQRYGNILTNVKNNISDKLPKDKLDILHKNVIKVGQKYSKGLTNLNDHIYQRKKHLFGGAIEEKDINQATSDLTKFNEFLIPYIENIQKAIRDLKIQWKSKSDAADKYNEIILILKKLHPKEVDEKLHEILIRGLNAKVGVIDLITLVKKETFEPFLRSVKGYLLYISQKVTEKEQKRIDYDYIKFICNNIYLSLYILNLLKIFNNIEIEKFFLDNFPYYPLSDTEIDFLIKNIDKIYTYLDKVLPEEKESFSVRTFDEYRSLEFIIKFIVCVSTVYNDSNIHDNSIRNTKIINIIKEFGKEIFEYIGSSYIVVENNIVIPKNDSEHIKFTEEIARLLEISREKIEIRKIMIDDKISNETSEIQFREFINNIETDIKKVSSNNKDIQDKFIKLQALNIMQIIDDEKLSNFLKNIQRNDINKVKDFLTNNNAYIISELEKLKTTGSSNFNYDKYEEYLFLLHYAIEFDNNEFNRSEIERSRGSILQLYGFIMSNPNYVKIINTIYDGKYASLSEYNRDLLKYYDLAQDLRKTIATFIDFSGNLYGTTMVRASLPPYPL